MSTSKQASSNKVNVLARSRSHVIDKVLFRWVIEHFSLRSHTTGEPITSSWFSDESRNPKECQFYLMMGVSIDSKKDIGLTIPLNNNHHPSIQVKIKLLNSNIKILAISGPKSIKLKNCCALGITLKMKNLFKKIRLLLEDELHILCELFYEFQQEAIVSGAFAHLICPRPPSLKENLITHFQQLLDKESLVHVTIDVQWLKFEALQLILSARSLVFFAILQNNLSNKKTKTFEVQGIEPEAFQYKVRRFYTDKAYKLNEMAPQLLAATDKYMLDLLKSKCQVSLARNVTLANCGELLILAQYTKETLLDFVLCKTSRVAVKSNWLLETANPQLLRGMSMVMMTTSSQVHNAPPLSLIKKDV